MPNGKGLSGFTTGTTAKPIRHEDMQQDTLSSSPPHPSSVACAALTHFVEILQHFGITYVTAETFRRCKFNESASTPLLLMLLADVLYLHSQNFTLRFSPTGHCQNLNEPFLQQYKAQQSHVASYASTNWLPEDCMAMIRLLLHHYHYKRFAELLEKDSNSHYSSRELLLAFVFLVEKFGLFELYDQQQRKKLGFSDEEVEISAPSLDLICAPHEIISSFLNILPVDSEPFHLFFKSTEAEQLYASLKKAMGLIKCVGAADETHSSCTICLNTATAYFDKIRRLCNRILQWVTLFYRHYTHIDELEKERVTLRTKFDSFLDYMVSEHKIVIPASQLVPHSNSKKAALCQTNLFTPLFCKELLRRTDSGKGTSQDQEAVELNIHTDLEVDKADMAASNALPTHFEYYLIKNENKTLLESYLSYFESVKNHVNKLKLRGEFWRWMGSVLDIATEEEGRKKEKRICAGYDTVFRSSKKPIVGNPTLICPPTTKPKEELRRSSACEATAGVMEESKFHLRLEKDDLMDTDALFSKVTTFLHMGPSLHRIKDLQNAFGVYSKQDGNGPILAKEDEKFLEECCQSLHNHQFQMGSQNASKLSEGECFAFVETINRERNKAKNYFTKNDQSVCVLLKSIADILELEFPNVADLVALNPTIDRVGTSMNRNDGLSTDRDGTLKDVARLHEMSKVLYDKAKEKDHVKRLHSDLYVPFLSMKNAKIYENQPLRKDLEVVSSKNVLSAADPHDDDDCVQQMLNSITTTIEKKLNCKIIHLNSSDECMYRHNEKLV